jgi:hypothetical protein
MTWPIKQIHVVTPVAGKSPDVVAPIEGDIVEVECVGGFVREVDPRTRQATARHQRFQLGAAGQLTPVHGGDVTKPLSADDRQRFSDAITELALLSRMERAKALMLEGKFDEAMAMAREAMDDCSCLLKLYTSPPDKGK